MEAELEQPVNNLTKNQRRKIARKPGRNNDLTKGLEEVKKTIEDDPFVQSMDKALDIIDEYDRQRTKAGF